jgi:hypothetical protein
MYKFKFYNCNTLQLIDEQMFEGFFEAQQYAENKGMNEDSTLIIKAI